MNTIDEQMKRIFGTPPETEAFVPALLNDITTMLMLDSNTLIALSKEMGEEIDAYGLSHSVTYAAMVGKIVDDAEKCEVASYVAIKTLETALKTLVTNVAARDGRPVEPLLAALAARIKV